eukprot:2463033-Pleurochrysis_carterae.AAC.1
MRRPAQNQASTRKTQSQNTRLVLTTPVPICPYQGFQCKAVDAFVRVPLPKTSLPDSSPACPCNRASVPAACNSACVAVCVRV